AAWALYEAWVTMQEPGKDVSLVYGFGKSSLANDLGKVLALQMDPYTMAPLWPDPTSVAALQARAMLDAGLATEEDFAEVASRNRRNALKNPYAQVARDDDLATLMAEAYVASPLRRHCLPPITDGCSALILVAGERAYDFSDNPAWITGIDHRMETHALGARDLTRSPSTERAALEAGVAKGGLDLAEIYAPYAHQELILAKALGLGADTQINPSGGALAANAIMSAGLTRIGEAATRIMSGEAKRAVAHASAGPVLQQNLVAVLEGAR
ncbi:MAG: lipid-transfer protein, partial [Actinobacteria bacterium]|nr:lipid-transfer protein [Actinomycetota bacterium]